MQGLSLTISFLFITLSAAGAPRAYGQNKHLSVVTTQPVSSSSTELLMYPGSSSGSIEGQQSTTDLESASTSVEPSSEGLHNCAAMTSAVFGMIMAGAVTIIGLSAVASVFMTDIGMKDRGFEHRGDENKDVLLRHGTVSSALGGVIVGIINNFLMLFPVGAILRDRKYYIFATLYLIPAIGLLLCALLSNMIGNLIPWSSDGLRMSALDAFKDSMTGYEFWGPVLTVPYWLLVTAVLLYRRNRARGYVCLGPGTDDTTH